MAPVTSLPDLQLLDVLERLPIPALRQSFWPKLPHKSQDAFRHTSRPAQRLAEQLTSRFYIDFWGCAVRPKDASLLGACLGRHEHVEVLCVHESQQEDVTVHVLQLGRAGTQRVREVLMKDCLSLTNTTGAALATSCPAMCKLEVLNTAGMPSSAMSAAFFTALNVLLHLSEVRVTGVCVDAGVMLSIAALPQLVTLHLVDVLDPDALEADADDEQGLVPYTNLLPHVATMTGLRSLVLEAAMLGDDPAAVEQLTLLAALTRLTSLDVMPPDHHAYSAELGSGRLTPTEVPMNAVLAQLGASLRQLQSLRMCLAGAFVTNVGMEGLRQLSSITRLQVDGMRLEHAAAPGGLPHLRELHLALPLTGAELLSGLQALLPLPSLTAITVTVSIQSDMGLAYSALTKPVDMAALQAVAQHLAAAPRLTGLSLSLQGGAPQRNADCTAVSRALLALAALQPRLQCLRLRSFSDEQMANLWAALEPFQQLSSLALHGSVGEMALLQLALHAHTLQHLTVDTHGASPVLAALFVTTRRWPLTVRWSQLTAEDLALIQGWLLTQGKKHVVLGNCVPQDFD